MEDLEQGKGQDDQVEDKMRRESAQEEFVAIDIALFVGDAVVPERSNRNAAEDEHESTQDEPRPDDTEKNQNGQSD